ncbi:MAG: hypothetical protein GY937_27365 [bacterium]|nr:hypothetical protein [bacterium]
MNRFLAIALVGLAIFAWTSSASAAQIDVQYGFAGASYDVGAPPSTATGTGTYTIRYSGGSTTLNGSLSSGTATLLSFGLTFTAGVPPTIFANTVPGFAVLGSQAGTRTAGGTDIFAGMAWSIPVAPPTVPFTLFYTGNLTHSIGSAFSGAGILSIPAIAFTAPWTVAGGSAELSRTMVPEPGLVHLLGSAAGMFGLAMAGRAGARRVRR